MSDNMKDPTHPGPIDVRTAEIQRLMAALAAEQASAERLELVVKQYASECGGCNGTGFIGVKYWRGDIEFDADDQPCPDCADIRAALALRPSGDGVGT